MLAIGAWPLSTARSATSSDPTARGAADLRVRCCTGSRLSRLRFPNNDDFLQWCWIWLSALSKVFVSIAVWMNRFHSIDPHDGLANLIVSETIRFARRIDVHSRSPTFTAQETRGICDATAVSQFNDTTLLPALHEATPHGRGSRRSGGLHVLEPVGLSRDIVSGRMRH